MGLSPWEIIVVGLVVTLLFGTRRLPELGTGLGKAIANFRHSFKEGSAIDVTPPASSDKSDDKKSEETKT